MSVKRRFNRKSSRRRSVRGETNLITVGFIGLVILFGVNRAKSSLSWMSTKPPESDQKEYGPLTEAQEKLIHDREKLFDSLFNT